MAQEISVSIDTLWVMVCAFLVFFMNTGFGCVEAGFCREKNAVNILAKNFVVFGIASLAYWAFGFGLMFAEGSSYFGSSGWFLLGADNSPLTEDAYQGIFSSLSWTGIPLFAKFFFQLAFAATAATIVSGCVAERIHYSSFMIFAFVLAGVVYPIAGHWVWGGGWLADLGMWDFAGSTVVHSVGGWAGLAGILFLGPRIGKYRTNGKVSPILGHSMPLAFLGGMILWLGWFGFNPGSTMGIVSDGGLAVSHIVVTTNIACAAGLLSATLFSYIRTKKPDFSMTVNGALAGLVGITAGCAFVTPLAALCIGAIAGILVVFAVVAFDRVKIDDPVGALSVHLVCGIWGTLAVGIWATTDAPGGIDTNGLLHGGGTALLQAQAIGVLAVGAFTFACSAVLWALLSVTLGIRVSPVVEVEGLDIHEMGMEAYPHERSIDVLTLLRQSSMGAHSKSLAKEATQLKKKRANQPPDAPVYHFKITGLDLEEFADFWNEMSINPKHELASVFRELYGNFSTMSDGVLRFKGGSEAQLKSRLTEIVQSLDLRAQVCPVEVPEQKRIVAAQ